jgi:hypothetical protein
MPEPAPPDRPAENHPRGNAIVRRSRSPDLSLFGLSMGSGHQACDQPALASSSQRRVASSVQPGNREPWSYTLAGTNDEMMSRFGVMHRCGVAAFAETHKEINRPKAKTERIAFASIRLPPKAGAPVLRGHARPRPQGVAASRSLTLARRHAGFLCREEQHQGGWDRRARPRHGSEVECLWDSDRSRSP